MGYRDLAKNRIMSACVSILVSTAPLFAAQLVVTTDIDSVPGSLRATVESAHAGDTISFSFSGTDTAVVKSQISLTKDIIIIGKNSEMRGNVIVYCHSRQSTVRITNCNVTLKTIIILGGFSSADSGGGIAIAGASSKVELDSVIVSRGRAACGGGIYINSSIVTIHDSRIVNNSDCGIYNNAGNLTMRNCTMSGNDGKYGGGIANYGGTLKITNCAIYNNTSSDYGGGIYNSTGTIFLNGDTITKNYTTGGYGGGMYVDSGNITISNCVISHDTASTGGGIYNVNGSVWITGGSVSNNRARSSGGGIYNKSGKLLMTNSTVSKDTLYYRDVLVGYANSSSKSMSGGGIYNETGQVVIDECGILDNCIILLYPAVSHSGLVLTDYKYKSFGGGICNVGGDVALMKSSLMNNSAYTSITSPSNAAVIYAESDGGGIYNTGSFSVYNSTLAKNSVYTYAQAYTWSQKHEASYGGGIYNGAGRLIVMNGTIANNSNGITNLGQCYFVNTIYVGNIGADYSVTMGTRAVNSLFSLGNFTAAKNCLSGVGSLQVFGVDTPTFANHGGSTSTISIGSPSSIAYGSGVRAGTFAKDTNAQRIVLGVAYYDGTAWLALETDSIVPAGTIVTEITTDQRGVARANPPCIGAFEFTDADAPVRFNPIARKFFQSVSLICNNLRIEFSCATTANIELFNLSGRKLFSNSMSVKPGIIAIALPSLANGPLICRLITQQGITTHKIMRSN